MLDNFSKLREYLFYIGILGFITLTPLYSQTLTNDTIEQLSQERHWKILLHFKEDESEIDDPRFFFADNGKIDLAQELNATINALLNDKSDDDNSTMCLFPARSKWIFLKLPHLKEVVYKPRCIALDAYVKAINAKQATLIFPTAHINSPASMFGHTLLRLDDNFKTPLLANSVNYAAATTESNGVTFAFKGIFGGYQGRYSVLPYYKKIDEYSSMESRDIWEYTLNLSPKELEDIVLHIYEISDMYADYWFFSENCSYNILWLLELAREDIDLVHQFSMQVTPIDTIRMIEENSLIKERNFRASKTRKMKGLFSLIEDKNSAVEYIHSGEVILDNDNVQEAQATLELATEYLRHLHIDNKVDKKSYTKRLIAYLRQRSKLGKLEHNISYDVDDPLLGHDSVRLNFGSDNRGYGIVGFKASYHGVEDIEEGYIPGAYINFLDFQVKAKKMVQNLINSH